MLVDEKVSFRWKEFEIITKFRYRSRQLYLGDRNGSELDKDYENCIR